MYTDVRKITKLRIANSPHGSEFLPIYCNLPHEISRAITNSSVLLVYRPDDGRLMTETCSLFPQCFIIYFNKLWGLVSFPNLVTRYWFFSCGSYIYLEHAEVVCVAWCKNEKFCAQEGENKCYETVVLLGYGMCYRSWINCSFIGKIIYYFVAETENVSQRYKQPTTFVLGARPTKG
jgi:hypothetical protein